MVNIFFYANKHFHTDVLSEEAGKSMCNIMAPILNLYLMLAYIGLTGIYNVDLANNQKSGPGCSKLTTSLVNVSLKFQTLISQIRHIFC